MSSCRLGPKCSGILPIFPFFNCHLLGSIISQEDGDARQQTCGKSPSSKTSTTITDTITSTTITPTQSSVINARRNFFPTPPDEAIHNVYGLKAQPKLVWYYHAAVGFPTKLPWLKAIKNKQYALWPGITWEAVNKHFPESKETTA